MAPPCINQGVGDFEVAELELVAVLVVAATVVVESEVEVGVDERPCTGLSMLVGGNYARP